MAGSPKTKKKKSAPEKENSSKKSKNKKGKGKEEDTAKNEELRSVILDDELWQSVIVLVVVEGQRLYNRLLQQLDGLPTNITVITPENLNSSEKESPGSKSRESSKSRKTSASKGSKKTSKTKETGAKKGNKKEKQNNENPEGGPISAATCILLKKYILELKNADFKEFENSKSKEQQEIVDNVTSHEKLGSQKEKVVGNNANNLIQRYIILWGFYDPHLLQECLNFNISLRAIIKIKDICPEKISTEIPPVVEKKQEKKQKGKAKKSFDQHTSEEYSIFTEKLDENMNDQQFLETNKDVLFLTYSTKTADEAEEATAFFKPNFSKILFGISEAWGMFSKYNTCLKIQDVPDISDTLTLEDAFLYTTMISMVPPECITVPVIIHSMLEQICWWDEHILSKIDEASGVIDFSSDNSIMITSRPVSPTNSKSVDQSFKTINKPSFSSDISPTNSKSNDQSFKTGNKPSLSSAISSESEISIPNITPILIDARDEIRIKTFHLDLPEINFQKITLDMLLSSPVYKLWLNYPLAPHSKGKFYEFHLQRFKKCTENSFFDCDKLFTFYLHQSVMNVLILNPDEHFMRLNYDNPIDDDESDIYLLESGDKTADNNSIASFIQGMMCNILCKVSKNCLSYSSEESSSSSTETKKSSSSSTETKKSSSSSYKEVPTENTNSEESTLSKWYEIKHPESSKRKKVLGEKLNYRLMKVNKLKSFLLHPEFVHLFEKMIRYTELDNTDSMKTYEFVENLNVTSMSQSLQEAYTNFVNVNYYYFALTDSILLWFNNSATKDLTMTRKVKGVLETPLGFRDFYKYKLGGKSKFEEMPVSETVTDVSHSTDTDNFSESFSSYQVSNSCHDSHSIIDEFLPTTVTNLGSSRVEHNECYDYFFSPDSTKVTIKKSKYFSNQMNIAVSVCKNNTSLHYNFIPEVSNTFIDITMKMYNDIMICARLVWSLPVTIQTNGELTITDSKTSVNSLSLSCDLKLTLPSGLLVEIVATESNIGPFYIRQRYLHKGPTCGKIWEESHRCFLKNGTILIFNSDNTVYILYNNGTMVKCDSFEWEKIVLESAPPEEESTLKENVEEIKSKKSKKTSEAVSAKGKKEGKGKGKGKNKEKEDDKNQNRESSPTSKKKKGKKTSNPIAIEENLNVEKEKTENEIYVCKITQFSVLSWDGFCTEYYEDTSQNNYSRMHDQRIALDKINQELYIERSDGMASLFTPSESSVLFPDGSKITSYTDDCKELDVENETLKVAMDTTPELGSVYEMENIRSATDSESISMGIPSVTSIHNTIESLNNKHSFGEDDNFVYVETSYLFEHRNYAGVKFNNNDCEVEIMLPGGIVVYIDKYRLFTIISGENEKITLSESNLVFEAQVLEESPHRTVTTLNFKNVSNNLTVSCQTVDSFCNVFSVNDKGLTSLVRNEADELNLPIPLHPENVERYFVLNRDLSGHEMIQNHKIFNDNNTEVVKTPIVKNSDELFTVYSQTQISNNYSEQYLMKYNKETNLPSLIKRKDLLKPEEMPDVIWFYPHLSKIDNECVKNSSGEFIRKSRTNPIAMSISKYSRIKSDINLSEWFSLAMKKYMKMGETIINKYVSHNPPETRNEEVMAIGELHKQNVLGSQSYYLTDNLPMVVSDILINIKEQVSIHSVSTSTESKLTSLLDMVEQIKQK